MQSPDLGEAPSQTQALLSDGEERFLLLLEGVRDYSALVPPSGGQIEACNLGTQCINGHQVKDIGDLLSLSDLRGPSADHPT